MLREKIKKISRDFFAKLLIFEVEIEVKKKAESYEIRVEAEEPGLIIGRNGETMAALEQILRLIINKKLKKPVPLYLDIAGYKDKIKKDLEESALRAAESALRTGRVQLLSPMNAFERRIVHLALSKQSDIETESIGQEPNRRVLVKARKKELA